MITVIFRAKAQPGKEEETLERVRKMGEAVEAQEPGALAYLIHRSAEDPSEIVFFEVYKDDAAFQAHAQTPHMGELREKFAELFDGSTVKVDRLERVGGFVRA